VPHPNATIAAYNAIKEAQASANQRVVGPCPLCEQPMVTDDPSAPAIVWPLTMHDGSQHHLQTAPLAIEGDTSLQQLDEQINAWEKALHRSQTSVASRIFEGSLLGVMMFPVLCWLFAVGMVILYLNHFFTLD